MLNSVSLTGRLTKEPEVFRTANELDIVRFTLAVNRVFKNKTGQRETDFIECVIFGKRALTFAGSTTKGSLLGISGRLSNNHFENKQGSKCGGPLSSLIILLGWSREPRRKAAEQGPCRRQEQTTSCQ